MLALDLMLEGGRRAQPDNKFWADATTLIARAAWCEAAYCLDAPDDIPAGCTVWDQIDEDLGFPYPRTVPREPLRTTL